MFNFMGKVYIFDKNNTAIIFACKIGISSNFIYDRRRETCPFSRLSPTELFSHDVTARSRFQQLTSLMLNAIGHSF